MYQLVVHVPPVQMPPDEKPRAPRCRTASLPVETPPVETPPVEKPPVEKPPVERSPIEKPSVEAKPPQIGRGLPHTRGAVIGSPSDARETDGEPHRAPLVSFDERGTVAPARRMMRRAQLWQSVGEAAATRNHTCSCRRCSWLCISLTDLGNILRAAKRDGSARDAQRARVSRERARAARRSSPWQYPSAALPASEPPWRRRGSWEAFLAAALPASIQ